MKKVLLLLTLFIVGIWVAWAQNRPFVARWGTNRNGEIHLPVKGTNWKLEVYKDNDLKKTEMVRYSDESSKIHVVKGLAMGAYYDVKIYPEGVEYIRCGSNEAKETAKLLLNIKEWGDIQWTTMERAFAGCTALYNASQGEPNLSKVKSCKEMFKGCVQFKASLNTWNMESVENLENMFDGCGEYTYHMASWTLASAKRISFGKVAKFNKDAYEQTIIGWANNPRTASDVVFDAKGMLYSSLEAKAAHDKLVNEKGWKITGDKYILFKFKKPVYYCKVGSSINVGVDFADGIEESKIRYTTPVGNQVIKVLDQETAEIGGSELGKATLTAKVKYGELDLETTCEIIVNATGEAPKRQLVLMQSGTGAGELNVRPKKGGAKLELATYEFTEGTKFLVNVDYDKNLASLELYINNENKTSLIGSGDYELTLDRDYTIEAILTEIKQWKVEFAAPQNGTMSVLGKDSAPLEAGKENKTPDGSLIVTLLEADAGYVLEAFRIDKNVKKVSEDNTYTFELKQDAVLEAFFSKENERSVVLDIAGGATNGTVKVGNKSLREGINKVAKDSKQKVTVKANEGYRVKSFTIAGEDKLAEAEKGVEVTFDKVVDIAVEFEKETTKIHVNWTAPEVNEGTITVRNYENEEVSNGGEVVIRTTIKVEVIPSKKYNLVELKAGNVDLLPTKKRNVYTYLVETTDVTLTYRFEPKPVPPTVKVRFNVPAATEGTITVTDAEGNVVANGGEVKKNTLITIKAVPAANHSLKILRANRTNLVPHYNASTHIAPFTVKEDDVTIVVMFKNDSSSQEEVTVTLNVNGDLNGNVLVGSKELVSGPNKVKKGKRQKVTAKANTGSRLKTFTIDGVNKLAEARTGVDIAFTRAVTIAVEFEAITQEEGDKTVVLTIVQPQDGVLEVVKASDGKTLKSGTKIEKGAINITVRPNEQYELEWLKVNEEDFTAKVNKQTHCMQYEVKADVTIRAKFKKGADDPSTAVEDAFLANVIVAPNPFTRALRIMGNEVSGVRYELFNAQGVVVRAGSVDTTEVVIDTEELVAGFYWVRLSDAKGATRVYRVVKQ